MLLVLLPLLPDRGVGGDDQAVAIAFRIGDQRLDDEIARALVQRPAIGGGLEQRRVVVQPQIFAERPQRFAPIVELDIGAALLGEEGFLGPVAEIANHRDLVIGAVDLAAHLAGRPRIEISEKRGARLRLVAHPGEGHRRPGHVADPRRRIDIGQSGDDQPVAVPGVAIGMNSAIGLAALGDAQHGFALPPQMALFGILEAHFWRGPPALELGDFPLDQRSGGKPRAPAGEFADGGLGFIGAVERDQRPCRARREGLAGGRRFSDFAQRDQQQGLVDPLEAQQHCARRAHDCPRAQGPVPLTRHEAARPRAPSAAMISAGRARPKGMKKSPLPSARRIRMTCESAT